MEGKYENQHWIPSRVVESRDGVRLLSEKDGGYPSFIGVKK